MAESKVITAKSETRPIKRPVNYESLSPIARAKVDAVIKEYQEAPTTYASRGGSSRPAPYSGEPVVVTKETAPGTQISQTTRVAEQNKVNEAIVRAKLQAEREEQAREDLKAKEQSVTISEQKLKEEMAKQENKSGTPFGEMRAGNSSFSQRALTYLRTNEGKTSALFLSVPYYAYRFGSGAVKGAIAIFRPSTYTSIWQLGKRVVKGEGGEVARQIAEQFTADPGNLAEAIGYAKGFGYTTSKIAKAVAKPTIESTRGEQIYTKTSETGQSTAVRSTTRVKVGGQTYEVTGAGKEYSYNVGETGKQLVSGKYEYVSGSTTGKTTTLGQRTTSGGTSTTNVDFFTEIANRGKTLFQRGKTGTRADLVVQEGGLSTYRVVSASKTSDVFKLADKTLKLTPEEYARYMAETGELGSFNAWANIRPGNYGVYYHSGKIEISNRLSTLDPQRQITTAHEITHAKTPKIIYKISEGLPYKYKPSEIVARIGEKLYSKGYKVGKVKDYESVISKTASQKPGSVEVGIIKETAKAGAETLAEGLYKGTSGSKGISYINKAFPKSEIVAQAKANALSSVDISKGNIVTQGIKIQSGDGGASALAQLQEGAKAIAKAQYNPEGVNIVIPEVKQSPAPTINVFVDSGTTKQEKITITEPVTEDKQETEQKTRPDSIVITGTADESKIIQTSRRLHDRVTIQKPEQNIIQIPITQTRQEIVTTGRQEFTGFYPKVEIVKTPEIFNPKKTKDSFKIFVKSKGKFQEIGQAKSLSEAYSRGAFAVDTSASASFKIEGGELFGESFLPQTRYRRSKRDKNVFVERRQFRIDTPGELGEITAKGIAKSRFKTKKKKGFFSLF